MKKFLLGTAFLAFSSGVFAAAGDLDVVHNVYTKHFNDSTYYSRDEGIKKYEEDNNLTGFRLGITDHFNIGYAKGTNSYGKDTNVYATEFTYPLHRYIDAGMMVGLADGYERISSNGWAFAGGPFLRAKTPVVGFTFGVYSMSAFTLTVDVPINSSFW